MSNARVNIESNKLNRLSAHLPRTAKVRYLPLTDQLLIYCDEEDFN